MSEPGLYLRCSAEQVGDRVILVGDRGRVRVVAELLEGPEWMNEDRGLTTVTGTYAGKRVTVCAFGMGAPLAVIVLHELARMGVRIALRLGTALGLPPTELGGLILAEGAVRGESTSRTYAPVEFPAVPSLSLNAAVRARLEQQSRPWRSGLVASYDGFYTEMFAVDDERRPAIEANRDDLIRRGVIAVDMETSALLVAGRALGVEIASLCLASVDGRSHQPLDPDLRRTAERELVAVGLGALAELP